MHDAIIGGFLPPRSIVVRSPMGSVALAGMANVLLKVFAAGTMLVATLVMGWWLGPEGVGVYAMGFATVTLAGIAARLGLESVVVREVAILDQEGRDAELRGLATFAPSITTVLAVGLGGGLVIGHLGAPPAVRWTLVAGVGLLVALTATSMLSGVLRGLHHVTLGNVPLQLLRPLVFAGGLGVLYTIGAAPEPWLAMGSHAAAAGVALVFAAGCAWWCLPTGAKVARPRFRVRAWLKAGLPLIVLGGFGIVLRQTDIIMTSLLAGDAQTGAYSVAVQLSGFALFVLQASNLVVSPRFAALHARGAHRELQHLVSASAGAVLLATLPIAVALVVVARPLLALYGDGFAIAEPAIQILAVAALVNAATGGVGQLLVMTHHERLVAWTFGITVGVNLVLNAWLIPRFGLVGAASATALSMVGWNVALVVAARRELDIDATVFGLLRNRQETQE